MWTRMGRLALLIASAVAAACGAFGSEGIDQAEASQGEAAAPATVEQVGSGSLIDWKPSRPRWDGRALHSRVMCSSSACPGPT